MATVGVIPAAGHATRLQPLNCSKEVYPIHGRPVMDFLVERMRSGGCAEIRVVTRAAKRDVAEHARRLGATVIDARPPSPAASIVAGLRGLAHDDIVLLGYPDSIWEPVDGFVPLIELIESGSEAALGLFRTTEVERPDVATLDGSGLVTSVDVGSETPPPHLMWGCATARARALRGLPEHDDPGDYLASLCRKVPVPGVILSDTYLDMGTPTGLRRVLASPALRR